MPKKAKKVKTLSTSLNKIYPHFCLDFGSSSRYNNKETETVENFEQQTNTWN